MRQKVFYVHGHVRLIERSVKVEYGLDARLRVCFVECNVSYNSRTIWFSFV